MVNLGKENSGYFAVIGKRCKCETQECAVMVFAFNGMSLVLLFLVYGISMARQRMQKVHRRAPEKKQKR